VDQVNVELLGQRRSRIYLIEYSPGYESILNPLKTGFEKRGGGANELDFLQNRQPLSNKLKKS